MWVIPYWVIDSTFEQQVLVQSIVAVYARIEGNDKIRSKEMTRFDRPTS